MILSTVQQEFTKCLLALMQKMSTDGYGVTLGEGWRTQVQAILNSTPLSDRKDIEKLLWAAHPDLAAAIGGSTSVGVKNSVHCLKLAQDLNLFKDGDLVPYPDQVYKDYGDWWKQQHPLARYGGDWGDSDHFSFEYQGVK